MKANGGLRNERREEGIILDTPVTENPLRVVPTLRLGPFAIFAHDESIWPIERILSYNFVEYTDELPQ